MTPMTIEEQLYQELCAAAKAGNVPLVESLIDQGAPLILEDSPASLKRTTTPVEHAIDASNLPLISVLASKGADLSFAGALKRAAHRIVQAVLYDRDSTCEMGVFELLAQHGALWHESSGQYARSHDHMFSSWRQGMAQEHPALLEKLDTIVSLAMAQNREKQLDTRLEPSTDHPAKPGLYRSPRF